jgi:hypothetical protein
MKMAHCPNKVNMFAFIKRGLANGTASLDENTKLPLSELPSHADPNTIYGRATLALYGHAMATSIMPVMDGIANVGTDNGQYARGDHKHPTDTDRSPINHRSTDTKYGVSSEVEYGHSKMSNKPPLMDGTVSIGVDNGNFSAEDHRHPHDSTKADLTFVENNYYNKTIIDNKLDNISMDDKADKFYGEPKLDSINIESNTDHLIGKKISEIWANSTDNPFDDSIWYFNNNYTITFTSTHGDGPGWQSGMGKVFQGGIPIIGGYWLNGRNMVSYLPENSKILQDVEFTYRDYNDLEKGNYNIKYSKLYNLIDVYENLHSKTDQITAINKFNTKQEAIDYSALNPTVLTLYPEEDD